MVYRLLDLYCGGGGAAKGYHDAGFEVTGVDVKFQPDYPYTFVQYDALQLNYEQLDQFDAIHASPPCQAYSAATVPARAAGKRIGEDGYYCCFGDSCTKAQAAKAMEIDWITNKEQLMESVPPAYTRFIGQQLLRILQSLTPGAKVSGAKETLGAAAKVSGLGSHNSHSTIRIPWLLMERSS